MRISIVSVKLQCGAVLIKAEGRSRGFGQGKGQVWIFPFWPEGVEAIIKIVTLSDFKASVMNEIEFLFCQGSVNVNKGHIVVF